MFGLRCRPSGPWNSLPASASQVFSPLGKKNYFLLRSKSVNQCASSCPVLVPECPRAALLGTVACSVDYCRLPGEDKRRKTEDILSRNSSRRYSMLHCEVGTQGTVEEIHFSLGYCRSALQDKIERQNSEWQREG